MRQSGTYWYHSHSGFQEQLGVYGPLVIEPREPEPFDYDREHVVMLTDWTDENPERVFAQAEEAVGLLQLPAAHGRRLLPRRPRATASAPRSSERRAWGEMRMSAADLADVTGYTYTYLMNGQPPAANWTGLFTPGERVRLRVHQRLGDDLLRSCAFPGLKMTVVAADGLPVTPVTVDEFRIAVAETYDVIVEPSGQEAFTIFAQAMDRTGFAAGTLAVRERLARAGARARRAPRADDGRHGPWRPRSPGRGGRPACGSHDARGGASRPARRPRHAAHASRPAAGHDMAAMAAIPHPATEQGNPLVDMQTMMPTSKLDDPGIGLRDNGRRVLTYADLRSVVPRSGRPRAGPHHRVAPDRATWSGSPGRSTA